MMAERFGKEIGHDKGKGGSMHLASTEIGILGANGITAGGMQLAVRRALLQAGEERPLRRVISR